MNKISRTINKTCNAYVEYEMGIKTPLILIAAVWFTTSLMWAIKVPNIDYEVSAHLTLSLACISALTCILAYRRGNDGN